MKEPHGVHYFEDESLLAVWCSEIDEEKGIHWPEYVEYCPMCGSSIDNPYNE